MTTPASAALGFPLSIHLEAMYRVNVAAFDALAEMLDYWSPPTPRSANT